VRPHEDGQFAVEVGLPINLIETMKRKKQPAEQLRFEWYRQMSFCFEVLSEKERADLSRWETENLPGTNVGTSDWPGWEKYIGKFPAHGVEDFQQRRRA